jgi:hypothetical protein
MSRVFISYRRVDSKWAVGRLYDRLSASLERSTLFLDVTDIEPGDDYIARIEAVVGSCDVLLAVIGRDWLTSQDSSGRRRLDNPKDWVRVEIAAALKRGIRVIPVLIDEAPMPELHALPDDLGELSRRNAKLVSFIHFHSDVDSLSRILEKVLRTPIDPTQSGPKESTTIEDSGRHARTVSNVRTDMPLTICIETEGGIATPLIYKGAQIPTQESVTFSTAADGQTAVTVTLTWGERPNAKDNLPLGTFLLDEIPPAKRGIPMIEITTSVDSNLIMTVTAKEKGTGRIKILDAVDLSRIEISDEMQKESSEKPRQKEVDISDMSELFGDFFGTRSNNKREPTKKPKPKEVDTGDLSEAFADLFGGRDTRSKDLDVRRTVYIRSGDTSVTVYNGSGQQIEVKIPSGIKDKQVIRCRGQGAKRGTETGDLYAVVELVQPQ